MTLGSLPKADQDAFAAWKGQVIKDCAWQQALPSLAAELPDPDGPYRPNARIDVAALLATTGGSRLVAGAGGELALLGPTPRDFSAATDQRTARHPDGGVDRVLAVSANRDGTECVIRLGNEEIFRGELAATLPVIAAYNPSALRPPAPALAALVDGRDGLAALDSERLLAPAVMALRPTAEIQGFLGRQLATTTEIARAVFPLGPIQIADVARLPGLPDTTPFAPSARVYGPRASLATVLAGGAVQAELLFDGLDPELIALRVELAIGANGAAPTVTAIAARPHVAHDDAAARACFTARAVAAQFEPEAPRSPAFAEQFRGCEHLASDGYAALAADATTREAIARKAFAAPPAPFAYRGWDGAAIVIAQRLAAQGVALGALDPTGALPALTTALDRRAALRAAPDDDLSRRAIDSSVIALTFGWFFDNLTPSPALLADLAVALRNTAPFYLQSVTAMLTELGDDVRATGAGARAVQCGLGVIGARRAELDRALLAVTAVPHAGSYGADLRGQILQVCPSAASIAALEVSAAATTAAITADEARAAGSATFALDAEALVARALDERWTAATFDALGDLLAFALRSDSAFCTTYHALAQQAACVDPGLDRFSAIGDGVLAPDVAARYATMARELMARWSALADSRFVSTRFDLTDAWAKGLWRGCSADGFARSKAQLYGLLDRLLAASTADRFELAQQIATLVDAQTCN